MSEVTRWLLFHAKTKWGIMKDKNAVPVQTKADGAPWPSVVVEGMAVRAEQALGTI